jgi:hypothetical protein
LPGRRLEDLHRLGRERVDAVPADHVQRVPVERDRHELLVAPVEHAEAHHLARLHRYLGRRQLDVARVVDRPLVGDRLSIIGVQRERILLGLEPAVRR